MGHGGRWARRIRWSISVLAGATVLATATAGGAMREHHPCPTEGPARVAHNSWSAAQHELAPAGAGRIFLCRYAGVNSHPSSKLVGNALVHRRSTIDRLTRRFDALKRPPGGAIACPNDNGSEVMATFFYPSGRQVTIRAEISGCTEATNGDVRRWLAKRPGPRLIRQLKRLTRKHRVSHG